MKPRGLENERSVRTLRTCNRRGARRRGRRNWTLRTTSRRPATNNKIGFMGCKTGPHSCIYRPRPCLNESFPSIPKILSWKGLSENTIYILAIYLSLLLSLREQQKNIAFLSSLRPLARLFLFCPRRGMVRSIMYSGGERQFPAGEKIEIVPVLRPSQLGCRIGNYFCELHE